MARYDNNPDEDRDYYERGQLNERSDRFQRERPWNYNERFPERTRAGEYRSERFGRGRFGERANYENDEPRYTGYSGRYREEDYDRSDYERDYYRGRREDYGPAKSRLRCGDIMTRDLAVATRDTTLREIAIMMKEEDTGVIPVVEFDVSAGNGRSNAENQRLNRGNYNHGKLLGLITDRDIVIRAVAEDKDCRTTR